MPWGSKSGVFIYLKDGERVRAELMSAGPFCSGIYTRTAVVDPSLACWLKDANVQKFPVK
ncbi:hypothetical protein ACIA8G_32350 [Lentzea sp. NPDC051213]|uniref:hypothetical protein n=1 Tax=Lentzea sp. NPDC051213 TaxID=3364126 RepID=UPI00379C6178